MNTTTDNKYGFKKDENGNPLYCTFRITDQLDDKTLAICFQHVVKGLRENCVWKKCNDENAMRFSKYLRKYKEMTVYAGNYTVSNGTDTRRLFKFDAITVNDQTIIGFFTFYEWHAPTIQIIDFT